MLPDLGQLMLPDLSTMRQSPLMLPAPEGYAEPVGSAGLAMPYSPMADIGGGSEPGSSGSHLLFDKAGSSGGIFDALSSAEPGSSMGDAGSAAPPVSQEGMFGTDSASEFFTLLFDDYLSPMRDFFNTPDTSPFGQFISSLFSQ